MFKIKVGGVPEHFNYPWLKCIDDNLFEKNQLKVEWIDCHGGTGEMASSLDSGEIDLAIMLTEGCIKEIESGKDFTIVQKYIESPLLWGIHVDAHSTYRNIEDLEGKTAAISQYNSGSHLMTHVLADREDWDLDKLNFKVCKTLNGAIKALKNKKADYLMWERFTTKPYVDQNHLSHLGNCKTPWPCFVIAAKNKYYFEHKLQIDKMLDVVNFQISSLKKDQNLSDILSQKYEIDYNDIKEWLSITEWSNSKLKSETMEDLKLKLKKYKIIE